MANEAYGLTQEDAEMVLRVCNNNEFEASDRLTEEEDGFTFLNAIRSMVAREKRAKKLTGRKRQAEEEQLASAPGSSAAAATPTSTLTRTRRTTRRRRTGTRTTRASGRITPTNPCRR